MPVSLPPTHHLPEFVRRLRDEDCCPNSLAVLEGFFDETDTNTTFWLQLCLAALYDVSTPLISATYDLEGNRLEILLAYERIQQLRSLGDLLRKTKNMVSEWLEGENSADDNSPSSAIPAQQLPSVARLVKEHTNPGVGTPISKYFHGSGRYSGRVVKKHTTWNPITQENEESYLVLYSDGDEEDLNLEACRKHFAEFTDANYLKILSGLIPAFDYLNARLDGACAPRFSCSDSLEIFR